MPDSKMPLENHVPIKTAFLLLLVPPAGSFMLPAGHPTCPIPRGRRDLNLRRFAAEMMNLTKLSSTVCSGAQASPSYRLMSWGINVTGPVDVKVAWGRGLHKVKTARPIAEPEFAK